MNSGVEAITAALKAMPAEQQVSTLLSKYAELAEANRTLQVSGLMYLSLFFSLSVPPVNL